MYPTNIFGELVGTTKMNVKLLMLVTFSLETSKHLNNSKPAPLYSSMRFFLVLSNLFRTSL